MTSVARYLIPATSFLAVAFFVSRQDSITQDNLDRIKEGMTVAEVEAILGPPTETKDWRPFRVNVGMSDGKFTCWHRQLSGLLWDGMSGTISVEFVTKKPWDDRDDRPCEVPLAEGVVSFSTFSPKPTLLDQLLYRLGYY